jgi:hypothetical protein
LPRALLTRAGDAEMQSYNVGGREFRALQTSTLEHDFWTMRHLREAGLDQLRRNPDETAEDFAVRLLHEIIASGKAFLLVGAFLIPANMQDADWTPEVGASSAAFFGSLTGTRDKQIIQAIVVTLLTSFFQLGLSYSNNSRTSLKRGAQAQPIKEQQNDALSV